MRHTLRIATALCFVLLGAARVQATEAAADTPGPAHDAHSVTAVQHAAVMPGAFTRPGPSRGSLLPALYVSLATLNAADAYMTRRGVASGAVEANPLMRGASGSSAVMWAVKGATTAATITVAERLWRKNRKAEAVAVMLVSNGLMAAVTARNASVLRQQR